MADNRAVGLTAETDRVLPVFVFDPAVLEHASAVRVSCLLDALESLREVYRERGGSLGIVSGAPENVLPTIASRHDATEVVWNEDYTGLSQNRDHRVRTALDDAGIEWKTYHDHLHHEPGSITSNAGDHYVVFSYFWKQWNEREKASPVSAPAPDSVTSGAVVDGIDGDSLPSLDELGFEPVEASYSDVTRSAALDRLSSFCAESIYEYDSHRDYPATGGTSRLSEALKWGTIGVRETYEETAAAMNRAETEAERKSVEAFQRQLAFREFYTHILAFNPSIVSSNFSTFEHTIEWRSDPDEVAAWKEGRTGFPIVDAGMRQLRSEAWMHNRVRMIVASFLTKDLLADWRIGYDWFRRHLADHDTANDVSGWQWAASTGADAQPYFRVFNPMKQGREYDPTGEYVRRYVPELADVETSVIHEWDTLSSDERDSVAPDYQAPIVDHASRRERAIELLEAAREE